MTTRSKRLQKDRKLIKLAHVHNEEENEAEKKTEKKKRIFVFSFFVSFD